MENEGYDFGGYSYSINVINKDNFDYYIFLNDTVIGPFIPRYNSKYLWHLNFISLISDEVKLVGPTINYGKYNGVSKHVQSMAFATDNVGLKLLINANILNLENNIEVYKNKGKLFFIQEFEVKMSAVILNNGYKITSFLQSNNYYKKCILGDIHYEKKYCGITINPIEVMFIKNNRINNKVLKNYIEWNS